MLTVSLIFTSILHDHVYLLLCTRPGGELVAGEDEIDGLKRSMTEVNMLIFFFTNSANMLTTSRCKPLDTLQT